MLPGSTETFAFDLQLERLLLAQEGSAPALTARELSDMAHSTEVALPHYQNELAQINSATFAYLNDTQKEALIHQIQRIETVITLQQCLDNLYQLDNVNNVETRRNRKQTLKTQEIQCTNYQRQLLGINEFFPDSNPADSPVKFFGIPIGQWLAKQLEIIANATPDILNNWLSQLNRWRLYWVWAGGLLPTVLQALPGDFYGNTNAQQTLSAPAQGLGYLSWILYYTRFALNSFVLLKHTVSDQWLPEKYQWLSPEERQMRWQDRFKTQWDQRKYTMLNDLAWSNVNLVCFFWLVGTGTLAYSGNALVAGLILFDITLKLFQIGEESTKYNRANEALKAKIADSEKALYELETCLQTIKIKKRRGIALSEADTNNEQINQAAFAEEFSRLKDLKKLKKSANSAWRIKNFGLINDLVYSSSLLVGWTLGNVLFPTAWAGPATMMALGMAGGIFCFVMTVAYHAINGGLEIHKTKQTIAENKATIADLKADFINADRNNEKFPDDKARENFRKSLFLEIKTLEATNCHQRQMIRHQGWKLLRGVVIDAMIPAVVFASLIFLPTGIGFGVLAAACALMYLSKFLLSKLEPVAEKAPDTINESEYEAFKAQLLTPPAVTVSGKGMFSGSRPAIEPPLRDEDSNDSSIDPADPSVSRA